MAAQLLKGALAKLNRRGGITQCFVFNLNPEQINRRVHWLEGVTSGQKAPCERLSFKLVLDAAGLLKRSEDNRREAEFGIRPQLAALQDLICSEEPPARLKRSSKSRGTQTSAPPLAFIWGREPIIPVWMVSLNVREELFDPTLIPIRASVWVELEVLMPGSRQAEFIASLSEACQARMREMAALAWGATPVA